MARVLDQGDRVGVAVASSCSRVVALNRLKQTHSKRSTMVPARSFSSADKERPLFMLKSLRTVQQWALDIS